MTDRRDQRERLTAIEGADEAALGRTPPPATAPPGAEVDATERLVPGVDVDAASPPRGDKPWASSLAATDAQAGVANEDPTEARPDPLLEDENRR